MTGHLSFSRLGDEEGCHTANIPAGEPHRFVFIAQRRYVNDYAFSGKFEYHFLRQEDVGLDCYLVAETDNADHPVDVEKEKIFPDDLGRLQGTIYIVRNHEKQQNKLRKSNFKDAAQLAGKIHRRYEDEFPFDAECKAEARSLFEKLREKGLQVLEFNFVLFRTGEFRVSPVKETFSSKGFAGASDASQDDFIQSMSSQAYYFLKDVAHKHYHHKRTQDNIIPLTRVEPDDDISWRRETMWSLVRAFLDERRSREIDSYARAKGILAYASAFQRHLLGHHRKGPQLNEFEVTDLRADYDLSFTEASLSARHQKLQEDYNNRSQQFFGAAGLLLAYLALFYTIQQNKENQILSTILFEKPFNVILGYIFIQTEYLTWARGRRPFLAIRWLVDLLDATANSLTDWFSKIIGPRNSFGFIAVRIIVFSIALAIGLLIFVSATKGVDTEGMKDFVFNWMKNFIPSGS
ncbi:hypothetical protein [Oceanicaulis sp.]|uniref:hypothetical protein n=1 Tax=Oceanicaulis sp. TaxID=1924941 RepID=UPI003D26537E